MYNIETSEKGMINGINNCYTDSKRILQLTEEMNKKMDMISNIQNQLDIKNRARKYLEDMEEYK